MSNPLSDEQFYNRLDADPAVSMIYYPVEKSAGNWGMWVVYNDRDVVVSGESATDVVSKMRERLYPEAALAAAGSRAGSPPRQENP